MYLEWVKLGTSNLMCTWILNTDEYWRMHDSFLPKGMCAG